METPLFTDEFFMKEALKEAQKAFDMEEVPVGAVIVTREKVVLVKPEMLQIRK